MHTKMCIFVSTDSNMMAKTKHKMNRPEINYMQSPWIFIQMAYNKSC